MKKLIKKLLGCSNCNGRFDVSEKGGKKLSELIGQPVVSAGFVKGSHNDPFSSALIPLKKTEYGVWCLYAFVDGMDGPSIYLEIYEDEDKYEPFAPFIEETQKMQDALTVSFSYNKFEKFKKALDIMNGIVESKMDKLEQLMLNGAEKEK